ncbi:MAG: hypothetical protein AUJ52_05695 [Elusimicrobia bacterium CG1_02_63_36]|nr:MAG: hypothetical protein AUJ52_05695 [Elusimicrobia bacterium CG1_02_63_36]
MLLLESVRTGAQEIWSHKTRSVLSLAAIAFGVAAILYTFAQINQMVSRREQALALKGPGLLLVDKEWQRGGDESPGLSKGLTSADADVIRRAMPGLFMVSPTLQSSAEIQYGGFKTNVRIRGITADWSKREWVYTVRGRFFNSHDYDSADRICVLNEPGGWIEKPEWMKAARKFWGWDKNPYDEWVKRVELIGRKIRLNDQIFTVVGVLRNPPQDKDPRSWGRRDTADVYVPLSTAQRYFNDEMRAGEFVPDAVNGISIDTGSEDTVATVMQRVQNLLSVRHRGEKDFRVANFNEQIQHWINQQREYAIQILAVGVVAILAGGVGIMNVTLATIFSRIKEIGIRRAVGATRFDILGQFVTEAMLLGAIGGVIGIAMALGGIKQLSTDATRQLEALLWWHYAATLAISVFTGFAFSLFPAYQASKLDPVEALRHE